MAIALRTSTESQKKGELKTFLSTIDKYPFQQIDVERQMKGVQCEEPRLGLNLDPGHLSCFPHIQFCYSVFYSHWQFPLLPRDLQQKRRLQANRFQAAKSSTLAS